MVRKMEKVKKSYDITQKLDVTKEELKVGTSREVSLSTGEVLNVNIPPKTVNGDVLSIKGLGKKKENGKRGNLNLVINLVDEDDEDLDDEEIDEDDENEVDEEVEKEKVEIKTTPKKKSKSSFSKKRKSKGDNFYNPNIINYDCVVFINPTEAENGCFKEVKIRPHKKIVVPIKKGIENEEIVRINIDGVIRDVLVIVSEVKLDKLDEMNKALSQSEVSLTKEDQKKDEVSKYVYKDGESYNFVVPKFGSRKKILYVSSNKDNPGIKVVVTKEDLSYNLGVLLDIILVIGFFWFLIFRFEEVESMADFFKLCGEGVGYFLFYLLLQYVVGNRRWK